jgi:hypothetical protein
MGAVKRYRLIKVIARWALAAMLFTQGALVANACLRFDTGPRTAFSTTQMADCEMGTANPNVCLFQYLDQSDQTTAQPLVMPAVVHLPAPAVTVKPAPTLKARAPLVPHGCDPPIPIRYCSLLI